MSENQLKNSQLFNAKALGNSLKEVSMEVLQSEDHDLEGRWFHSQNDLDFFLWKDENFTIIKQQLCFKGLVAEWNIVEGVRTGTVDMKSRPMRVSASALIEYHEMPEPVILDQARQICEHIVAMGKSDNNQCLVNWRKPLASKLKSLLRRKNT